jgi:hypothetical protein
MFVRYTATVRHRGGDWITAPFTTIDHAQAWAAHRIATSAVVSADITHTRTRRLRLVWHNGRWAEVSRYT